MTSVHTRAGHDSHAVSGSGHLAQPPTCNLNCACCDFEDVGRAYGRVERTQRAAMLTTLLTTLDLCSSVNGILFQFASYHIPPVFLPLLGVHPAPHGCTPAAGVHHGPKTWFLSYRRGAVGSGPAAVESAAVSAVALVVRVCRCSLGLDGCEVRLSVIRAPVCPVCVPCESRLPPVSFYPCVPRLPPVSFYR